MHRRICPGLPVVANVDGAEGLGGVDQLLHEGDVVGPEDGERERLPGHEDHAGVRHQHNLLHEVLLEDVAPGHLQRVSQVTVSRGKLGGFNSIKKGPEKKGPKKGPKVNLLRAYA